MFMYGFYDKWRRFGLVLMEIELKWKNGRNLENWISCVPDWPHLEDGCRLDTQEIQRNNLKLKCLSVIGIPFIQSAALATMSIGYTAQYALRDKSSPSDPCVSGQPPLQDVDQTRCKNPEQEICLPDLCPVHLDAVNQGTHDVDRRH